MKQTSFILALTLAAALPALAAEVDLSKLPPPSDKKDLTYVKDIEPIFKSACYNCHSETRPRKNLRLDSLEAALKGGDDGKVITPGDSKGSDLVIMVSRIDPTKVMPPAPRGRRGGAAAGGTNAPAGGMAGGAPPAARPGQRNLTPEEVGLIRAWIDQGAK